MKGGETSSVFPPRRSKRVRENVQNTPVSSQQGINDKEGQRTIHISKHHHPSSIYPSLSTLPNDDMANLLQAVGFKEFYSSLNWDEGPSSRVADFLMSSDLVHKEDNESEIFYIAPHCRFPMVITMDKLAQAFQLSLDGMDETTAPATAEGREADESAERFFQLDSAGRYYRLSSGKSYELCTASKFVRQALFLLHNRSIMTKSQMKILTAALEGKPVAWAKILWTNLVRRMSSFHELASRYGTESQHELSVRLSNVSYGAVLVALLSKLEQNTAVLFSPNVPTTSLDGSSDSDELFVIEIAPRKKPRLVKVEVPDSEVDAGQNASIFAVGGSRSVCQRTGDMEGRGMEVVYPLIHLFGQNTASDLLVKKEKVSIEVISVEEDISTEENISIGKSSADCPVEEANNSGEDAAAILGDGNSAEFVQNLQGDHSHEVLQQFIHGSDSSTPHVLDKSNRVTTLIQFNMEQKVRTQDDGLEAGEAVCNSQGSPEVSAAVAEERSICSVDAAENPVVIRITEGQTAEMTQDHSPPSPHLANMPCQFECQSSMPQDEGQLIPSKPMSAQAPQKTQKPRQMTDLVQVPATSLVKLAISIKHFLDGLNEAGVPKEVYVNVKAEKLMEALRLELQNRDLEDFSERTDLFGMNQSMDTIFDSVWTLQDLLRTSQKECASLGQEMDTILTRFTKEGKSTVSDFDPSKLPLYQQLQVLKAKMNKINACIVMKEAALQRGRKDWLKQRGILIHRRNETKLEQTKQTKRIDELEAEIKLKGDKLRECMEKLHTESVSRKYSEANIESLEEEIQYLKVKLMDKSAEIENLQRERLEEANLLNQKLEQVKSEVQMKDVDLAEAVSEINVLKQTLATISGRQEFQNAMLKDKDTEQTVEALPGRLEIQDGILKDKDVELSTLREEIAKLKQDNSALEVEKTVLSTERQIIEAKTMNLLNEINLLQQTVETLPGRLEIQDGVLKDKDAELSTLREEITKLKQESSALELEKEILSKEKQKVEADNTKLLRVNEEKEERLEELKCKLSISKERVAKSELVLAVKEQETISLATKFDAAEKRFEECKASREMAFAMVKRQKNIQDSYKKQTVYLQDKCEKLESRLEKHLKRQSHLLRQIEEERDRMEEGHFNQEQQGIRFSGEPSDTQSVEDMKEQLTKLRIETREILASSLERLNLIVTSHSVPMKSSEKSSASSAG
ncbi:hypothetical protein R1sor_025263 [Riccia sorocarpa]|uniref:Uncharacterized protein n=1 Tax=Riccia sorocarpa TaxID=122646 RepID=A0ABD3G847_9MARC